MLLPAGFTLGDTLENAAINAPYDNQGYNTYMGATIFTKGTFSIQACADYCSAQTACKVRHPANDGTPPEICNFFNTYMLYLNNASTPQGQYCSLHTEAWPSSYGTNTGQYRGSDRYFVAYSYTFKNSTSVAPAPNPGDVKGAIYQARQDMTYYPSQLTSTFQPYCSSILTYTTPVTTTTETTTTTPIVTSSATSSVVVTITVPARAKRDVTSSSVALLTTSGSVIMKAPLTTGLAARAAAASPTPAVLSKYPGTIVSSACSLIATPVTSTSTSTIIVTATAVASTIIQSTVTTTTTTTTAAATLPTCIPQSISSADSVYHYSLSAKCDTTVNTGFVYESSYTGGDAFQCLMNADADPHAIAMTFDTATNLCTFYVLSDNPETATVQSQAGVVFGYYDELVEDGYLVVP